MKGNTKTASILQPPPGPKAGAALSRFRENASSVVYCIHPNLVQSRGRGSLIEDADGNVYIDFLSGAGVNALGHANPVVLRAAARQMRMGMHFDEHIGPVPVYTEFLARIKETMGPELRVGKGMLVNSGTEAVEAAMKLVRYKTGKPTIIALDPCFHGRTLGSLAATTGASMRDRLLPVLAGVVHAKYPYSYRAPQGRDVTEWAIGTVEDIIKSGGKDGIAAVMMEPIAGETGVIVPPADYPRRLRELCDRHGILLIFDEVQTGVGRTGKWWAMQHYGVEPDVVTFAKASGGGLPIGGIIARKELAESWAPGHHASTFGGNPVACAAGIATMDEMQAKGVVEMAARSGDYIMKKLRKHNRDSIGEIRGKGMIIGIELVSDKEKRTPAPDAATAVLKAALKKGLVLSITGPNKNVVRLLPALNIRRRLIDDGMRILEESFAEAGL